MESSPLRSAAAALLLAVLTAGCAGQSQPSSFYLLSYPSGPEAGGRTTSMREGLGLGIGPVTLPQYLDRPQIVVRSRDNSLNLEEFDRWGGRLEDNFATVLAEVLSAELETDRVSVYPWSRPEQVEYQIIVTATAFETDADGQSVLDARWSIVDSRRQNVLAMARSTLREAVAATGDPAEPGADYDATAAAMSRNVASLGREIAGRLRALAAP